MQDNKEFTTVFAEDANDIFLRLEPFDLAYYEIPKLLVSRSAK
jgi:hypothetical protein